MRLVKDGRIVADRFVRVPDDAPVPQDAAAIVSHGRLLAEPAELLRRSARSSAAACGRTGASIEAFCTETLTGRHFRNGAIACADAAP